MNWNEHTCVDHPSNHITYVYVPSAATRDLIKSSSRRPFLLIVIFYLTKIRLQYVVQKRRIASRTILEHPNS